MQCSEVKCCECGQYKSSFQDLHKYDRAHLSREPRGDVECKDWPKRRRVGSAAPAAQYILGCSHDWARKLSPSGRVAVWRHGMLSNNRDRGRGPCGHPHGCMLCARRGDGRRNALQGWMLVSAFHSTLLFAVVYPHSVKSAHRPRFGFGSERNGTCRRRTSGP